MPKYTDDQINEAIMLANHTGKVYAWEAEMYRSVINYLPDPDNEWEPSNVTHVRKGDRVRWTVPGCEDNESYEIVVAAVTNQDGVVLHSETRTYYFPPGSVVDRIPAPVQHPDPEVNEFILDEDGDVWRVNSLGTHYAKHGLNVHPEYFAGFWTPAKVIADE